MSFDTPCGASAAHKQHQRMLEVREARAAIEFEGVAPCIDDSGDAEDHAFESARQDKLDRIAA